MKLYVITAWTGLVENHFWLVWSHEEALQIMDEVMAHPPLKTPNSITPFVSASIHVMDVWDGAKRICVAISFDGINASQSAKVQIFPSLGELERSLPPEAVKTKFLLMRDKYSYFTPDTEILAILAKVPKKSS